MNKNLFSIFSIFIIFILFSLGGWQLVRLQWKKDLIKDINLSISQPAKSLITENIKNYQKVKSQGTELVINKSQNHVCSKKRWS